MKRNRLVVLVSVLLISNVTLFAQQGDILKSEAITIEQFGNYIKAAQTYGAAVDAYEKENKLDTLSIFKTGQCYAKGKDYNNALSFLQRCVDMNYNDPGVYLYLGIAQEGLSMKADAEQSYIKGKTMYPEVSVEYQKKLGQLYFKQKKYTKASAEVAEALKSYPEDETLLYFLGSSYDQMKKYDEAIEAFRKILSLNPNHKNATTKLGVVYYKKVSAKYKNETKKYEAIKAPSRIDYHNYKKKLESLNSEYKLALPYLEKAHELSPSNKSIKSCLSITYKRLGMKDKESEINKLL